ncbi:uncharacterized protein LOC130357961 isoform X1 [Hyla sarda]|uniref:uncharacterized protein LOC130357961 isoform X1 n=1 Tax=Hyla sarda TaxID=327740 RepID=UPI0024C37CE7|nr:uncharacterized protein LOC130357961 isoform X1 [Hyla sarda]
MGSWATLTLDRQNKEELSPNMERKQRGKFVSLTKREAEIVLETYIQRSISTREVKRTGCKKEKKLQRSISDVTRFTHKLNKSKIAAVPQAELEEKGIKDSEDILWKGLWDGDKATPVKKQSWFKSFLNKLFKKEANISESGSVTSTTDGHSDQAPKKNSSRKDSLRRALSFKKSNADKKLKRPTNLPLEHVCRPHPLQPCEINENCYYEQVSTEIELLVKDTENLEVRNRKQSLNEEGNNTGTEDMETMIKKIVAILQKEGDAYNRKIKEDPAINNFFRDFSYNSFKQLADVYVDNEVKKRDSVGTPEDMKFAFSVHFTKQVVGLSTHPITRIMGFGTRYLQDTFTLLSYSRDDLTHCIDLKPCLSPD